MCMLYACIYINAAEAPVCITVQAPASGSPAQGRGLSSPGRAFPVMDLESPRYRFPLKGSFKEDIDVRPYEGYMLGYILGVCC